MQKSPLIFIHKSDIKDSQSYLLDTFVVAKHFNPDMQIILLGDDNNKHYAKDAGIEFDYYEKYSNSEKINRFEKVFKVIKGKNHGGPEWIKFVFKRWFHIYEFVMKNQYSKFWTFDSDNLILTNLYENEYKFSGYDCTEQCNGACINGFVSNKEVIAGYLDKINDLFEDDYYISKQQHEFDSINTNYAFTEMRAYAEYKKEYSTIDGMNVYPATNFKSVLLQSIINGEMFDPALAQNSAKKICCEECDSGYEMESGIKKMYFRDNKIYFKFVDTGQLIRACSINMSWTNKSLWKKIIDYTVV